MKRVFLIFGCAAASFFFVNAAQRHAVRVGETINVVVNAPGASDTSSWTCDPAQSRLRFNAVHMGLSEVEGYFKLVNGKMFYTKPDMSDAKIQFIADVKSLNSENEMRDKQLKGEDFFDADTYPKMIFKSTSFTPVPDQKNKYKLAGNLTIRDATRPVVFDVTYNGTHKDPYGNTKSGYKATTTINRFDYNLKWNTMAENVAIVSENVDITCNIEFKKEEKK